MWLWPGRRCMRAPGSRLLSHKCIVFFLKIKRSAHRDSRGHRGNVVKSKL